MDVNHEKVYKLVSLSCHLLECLLISRIATVEYFYSDLQLYYLFLRQYCEFRPTSPKKLLVMDQLFLVKKYYSRWFTWLATY